jgi:hypothetical protein
VATKKDLVEAYSFSRRRLVTAFVSGAPGGREVEPARPGRTIVGGAALAVLLIAGAAIAGVFSPTVPDDWNQPGRLIVSKETAEVYVIPEVPDDQPDEDAPSVLRPVINTTSAKLILGTGIEPLIVPQSEIDKQQIGDAIGILGGPDNVPAVDNLIPSDWSACTAGGHGIRVAVADDPPVSRADGAGLLVKVDDDYYLIATSAHEDDGVPRAYSYRLPNQSGARDNMISDLQDVNSVNAVPVSNDFLGLFPEGGQLAWESFRVDGAGEPDPHAGEDGIPATAEVGDLLDVNDEHFLLTRPGPVQLSDFAYAVYSNLPDANVPRVLTSSGLDRGRVAPPYDVNHWPDDLPALTADPETPCAVLLPQEDGLAPGVVPGMITGDSDPVDASPATVPEDTSSPRVQTGRGAFVLSADWDRMDGGSPFVIHSSGKAFSILGSDTAALLGYADVDPRLIPDSWRELFEPGVPLSQDAALCPPTAEKHVSC